MCVRIALLKTTGQIYTIEGVFHKIGAEPEIASGKLLKELTEHGGVAHCVAFSPDGKSLAFGTSEGLIHIVDSETYQARTIPKAHRHPVSSLAFSPCLIYSSPRLGKIHAEIFVSHYITVSSPLGGVGGR